MRPVLLLLATLAALPAAALDRLPQLRATVAVDGDIVTLGDLVENVGTAADTPVFRAPDPGAYGTIQAWRVVDAARGFGIDRVDMRGVAEVRVERAGRRVTEAEVADLVGTEMLRRIGTTDRGRVEVRLERLAANDLDAGPGASLHLERFAHDAATNRFDAVLVAIDGNGRRSRTLRLFGTAIEQIDVVRARRTLARGEVINASDVVLERLPRSRTAGEVSVALAEFVGMAARRVLTDGALLRPGDVERPRIVQRNEIVTIVFEAGALTLTARGRAQEAGGVGDTIDVQNVASRRTVQAVVQAPGRVVVRVGQTPRRIAQTAPNPAPAPAPAR